MKLEIEQNMANAMLEYLKGQPWGEVNNFIVALMQAKPATQETEDDKHGEG